MFTQKSTEDVLITFLKLINYKIYLSGGKLMLNFKFLHLNFGDFVCFLYYPV